MSLMDKLRGAAAAPPPPRSKRDIWGVRPTILHDSGTIQGSLVDPTNLLANTAVVAAKVVDNAARGQPLGKILRTRRATDQAQMVRHFLRLFRSSLPSSLPFLHLIFAFVSSHLFLHQFSASVPSSLLFLYLNLAFASSLVFSSSVFLIFSFISSLRSSHLFLHIITSPLFLRLFSSSLLFISSTPPPPERILS
jgi:hypothetical protein